MMNLHRAAASRRVLLLTSLILLLCSSCRMLPSPVRVDAGPELAAEFGHDRFNVLLKQHVDDEGRVNYTALRADRAALDHYVAQLAVIGPESTPEAFSTDAKRLAYWINAYNALVLFQVVEREGLDSVGDSKFNFFYWTCFELDGGTTNLYDLENDVIRARFEEPRIHFALNCASAGCPRLPNEAFQPERLEEQLERETRRFLSEQRNVNVEDGAVLLSELFDWFPEDFGGDPVAWIRAHDPALDLPAGAPVRFRTWDWSLNEQ